MTVLLILAGLVVAGVLVVRSGWFRGKLRAIEWSDRRHYIRFWPNPGFRIGRLWWSKFYGWRKTR